MKRRVFTLFLAAILLVSTVVVAAPAVSAADDDLKASDKIVDLIKSFEGFTATPKEDVNGMYTIGYGTTVDPDDYPNGITKEKAEELLKDTLVPFETSVNTFANRNRLDLSQNQFDALVSFTYNLGAGWLSGSNGTALRNAVINGATGNEFIYAMTLYCNAGGKILTALVNRRLIEANVYLNNVYSTKVPATYDYVLFNTQMDSASGTSKIQGYDSSWNTQVIPNPTKSGYRFLGWYTKATGGEWVTNLNASHAGDTLYGHWQKGSGTAEGTPANYNRITTQKLSVYDAPNGKFVKEVAAKTTVTIYADYVDGNGVKWGKANTGWIKLTSTRAPGSAVLESNQTINVTVTTNGVNVRKGPGTNYGKVGTADKGDVLTITQVQRGVNYLWGQFEDGWICLDYTNYENVIDPDASGDTEQKVNLTGTIVKTNKLNIRNRPGTSGTDIVGTYAGGTTVTITAQQKVGKTTWGKTDKGWISLYYVELKKDTDTSEPDEEDKDEDNKDEGFEEEKVTATGVIVKTNKLNIRNNPGTSGTKVVGSYAGGDVVTITAQTKVGKTTWGKTDKGWISLYYVELSPVDTGPANPDDVVIATGVIDGCITLRVRKGPGTRYAKVGALAAGTEVKIYQITGGGNDLWGRISGGWISLNYVDLDVETPESGTGKVGVVYNCTKLNVRAGAGTHNKKVARIDAGTKVEVFETTEVKGVTWGRISLGWVSMDYIKLSGETQAPDTDTPQEKPEEEPEDKPAGGTTTTNKAGTIVKTTELRVRAGAGTKYDKVATLKRGDRVVILETTKVGNATWGRIDKGWIHMYYVELDNTVVPEGAVYRTVTTTVAIRAGAGTNYDKLGSYKKGEVILVYEQTNVKDRPWGRTDKGWLCLEYVK